MHSSDIVISDPTKKNLKGYTFSVITLSFYIVKHSLRIEHNLQKVKQSDFTIREAGLLGGRVPGQQPGCRACSVGRGKPEMSESETHSLSWSGKSRETQN